MKQNKEEVNHFYEDVHHVWKKQPRFFKSISSSCFFTVCLVFLSSIIYLYDLPQLTSPSFINDRADKSPSSRDHVTTWSESPDIFKTIRQSHNANIPGSKKSGIVTLPPQSHLPQNITPPTTTSQLSSLSYSLFNDVILVNEKNKTTTTGPFPPLKSTIAVVSINYDRNVTDYRQHISRVNHDVYASAHGYDRIYLPEALPDVSPTMTKYMLLTWAFEWGYEWLLFLEQEALVSNMTLSIEDFLEDTATSEGKYDTSIVAPRGSADDLYWRIMDNRVFLMKNSEWSRNHCFEVVTSRWVYPEFWKERKWAEESQAIADDRGIQLSLLLEGKELTWPSSSTSSSYMLEQDDARVVERSAHVTIVSKKRLFPSFNGINDIGVSPTPNWEQGDWIVHWNPSHDDNFSSTIALAEDLGLSSPKTVEEEWFPHALIGINRQDTQSGMCWCNDEDGASDDERQWSQGGVASLSCLPQYHVIGVHKAGTKALLTYMRAHPRLLGPYIEDMGQWLTGGLNAKVASLCAAARETALGNIDSPNPWQPIYAKKGGKKSIYSCSFQEYSRVYGEVLQESRMTSTSPNNKRVKNKYCNRLAHQLRDDKILYDELVVWTSSLKEIKGTTPPKILKTIQPTARLIVTVRHSIDVTYSAYQHFGSFLDENDNAISKTPDHFHEFALNVTTHWTSNNCHPSNYQSCLPKIWSDAPGSWFARGMYAPYLRVWLDEFGCDKMFVFDISGDLDDNADDTNRTDNNSMTVKLERLFDFMGVGGDDEDGMAVARSAAGTVEEIKSDQGKAKLFGEKRSANPMNKAVYDPMLDKTRNLLEHFFAPYDYELCELMSTFNCMDVGLFRYLCRRGLKYTKGK